MSQVTAVILAAGHGTRMKSNLLKVLHPVGGKPMLGHVVDNCRQAGVDHVVVVVGYQRERVREYLKETVQYATQDQQIGTGHAVMQAEPMVPAAEGELLVLYGDSPFIGPDVIGRLLAAHREAGVAATLLTAHVQQPGQLGRVVRDETGRFTGVAEYKDASAEQREIQEIASGIYVFRRAGFFDALRQVQPANAQGEYYLPDVLNVLMAAGHRVQAVPAATAADVLAPNDRFQLAAAEAQLRQRVLQALMASGVTVVDPHTTWVGVDVQVGRDAVLMPGTFIEGQTVIGENSIIGPGSRITDSRVGAGCRVEMSVIEASAVGPGCRVGPFAHLRPGCDLGNAVEVGNYAELKNARVGDRVKIHHHSYLGDAEIEAEANIGAGAITCNYDGVRKHKTLIRRGAFVGTNVNLVAPIAIGEDAYVAAGSTVNQDVPAGALAIARPRQENKAGYVARLRSRIRTQGK